MKTVFVLLVALCLIFSTVAIVAAADNSGNVYFDLGVSGSSSNNLEVVGVGKEVLDYNGTSGYLIGGEYDFGSYLVVAEYTSNSFQNSKAAGILATAPNGTSVFDYSSSTTLIRGGYYFINNDKVKFNGILGYMTLNVTNKDAASKPMDLTNGGPLVGLDATYNFFDKFSLNGSYAMTIGASDSMDYLDTKYPGASKSSSLTTYRIKGLYTINDQWGAYMSYSSLTSSLRYKYTAPAPDINVDSTWSGFALGANYKF
jgi:hypothetical protein